MEIQESCFFLHERQTYISRDLFISWRNKNSRVHVLTKNLKFNNLVFFLFQKNKKYISRDLFISWRNQQNSSVIVFTKKRMKISQGVLMFTKSLSKEGDGDWQSAGKGRGNVQTAVLTYSETCASKDTRQSHIRHP